jgi:hypothetical protein
MITGGVDIGGTKIAVGAIDRAGRLLAREETPTAAARGFTDAMERVAAMLARVRAQLDRPMQGVGIGCTGPVDPVRGTIGNVDFLPGWQGANPVATLAARLQLPVAMENDADAAALAEAAWGAGRGRKTLIGVTVGTGIGAGILLNGAIYRGVDGAHPEIGHHVIDGACTCGARGCREALAAARPSRACRYGAPRPPRCPCAPRPARSRPAPWARAGRCAGVEEVARASGTWASALQSRHAVRLGSRAERQRHEQHRAVPADDTRGDPPVHAAPADRSS